LYFTPSILIYIWQCCLLNLMIQFEETLFCDTYSELFEARRFWQKHPPLICQLPLTKSTTTELQRIDTPVPLPEPACRCHLERTDDRQTAIETCKGSSRDISWLGISSYKPSRVISWLGLKELIQQSVLKYFHIWTSNFQENVSKWRRMLKSACKWINVR
jgi:hypothetical protein